MNLPFQDKQTRKEKWMRAGTLRQNIIFIFVFVLPKSSFSHLYSDVLNGLWDIVSCSWSMIGITL